MQNKILAKACEATEIFIEKLASRKFLVWLVATHMSYFGFLESSDWLFVSMLYVGAQATLDYRNINKQELLNAQ